MREHLIHLYSYHYARRQYNLADDANLRYQQLEAFDVAMLNLDKQYSILSEQDNYVSRKHENDKIIAFEKGHLLFLFNFHPTHSYVDYRIGTQRKGFYKVVLSSDDKQFGGWERIFKDGKYYCQEYSWDNRPNSIQVYLPARTCLVLLNHE